MLRRALACLHFSPPGLVERQIFRRRPADPCLGRGGAAEFQAAVEHGVAAFVGLHGRQRPLAKGDEVFGLLLGGVDFPERLEGPQGRPQRHRFP